MAKKVKPIDSEPKKDFRSYQFNISKSKDLFQYCDDMCFKSKNMYNVTNFYIRQIMTGVKKDKSLQSENEKEVFKMIQNSLIPMNNTKIETYEKKLFKYEAKLKENPNNKKLKEPSLKLFEIPSKDRWLVSYDFSDGIFKTSNQPDYRALPAQCSQGIIKQCLQDWSSFFELNKKYWADPNSLTGKLNIPKYAKKEGRKTTYITNQDAVIYPKKNQSGYELKLPKTKLRYNLGEFELKGKLKEVRIVPKGTGYTLELVCEVSKTNVTTTKGTARRMAAIDLGVNNFVTMTNNIGERPIIIKGGILKSKNQWYNKQRAHYYGILRQGKSPKEGQFTSKRLVHLDEKRHRFMKDFFHKTSKQILQYCVEHQIDTLVIGKNKGWKTDIQMKKEDKQQFTGIPFNLFISILTYKLESAGILVIETEESYTSKASFLDRDEMPTYGKEVDTPKFSGYRKTRGMYKSYQYGFINADVNGSANILRKVFPSAFTDRDKGVLKAPQPLIVSYKNAKKKQQTVA